MMIKPNLKIKFIIFISSFTILFSGLILSYFYISGRQYIKRQADLEVEFYARLFTDNIHKELSDIIYEVAGLKTQMEPILSSNSDIDKSNVLLITLLEQFIFGYPFKYTSLTLFGQNRRALFQLSPTKIFGGETKSQIQDFDLADLPLSIKQRLEALPADDELIVGPELGAMGRLIKLFYAFRQNQHMIFEAAVSLDELIEQVMLQLNLPLTNELTVIDSSGIIINARDEHLLNRYLYEAVPEISNKIRDGDIFFEYGSTVCMYQKLKVPAVSVLIKKNMYPEIAQLNARSWRILFFTMGIFVIVLLGGWILAERMAHSFREVIRVANRVAGGDFSEKINIHRRDELGMLISAFNEMVDKLNASYQALNKVNIELEHKIDELVRTKEELSQKQRLALIGEVISKVSHEIQNKIGGVSIWVQNLELVSRANETSNLYIQEMKLALKSFMDMLINFKRFYREPQLNRTAVNLCTVVKSAIKRCMPELNAKELHVVESFDKCEKDIFIDKDQFENAIVNILLNAVYYSPQRGTVNIHCSYHDSEYVISITDQGPGVDEKDKDKIFHPFYTTKTSGSGLGLAIVENIVRAHHGKIHCFNSVNGGACFQIKLPAQEVDGSS